MADDAAEARIDLALARRVQHNGDRQAFEQLVRRHQGTVRAQLRRLLHGDDATADDLAQETFVLAWRKLDQFRGDARFSTWLYRVAYSCFLQARRRPAQPEGDEDGGLEQLPAPRQRIDLQLDLEQAMRRLSPAEQAVLLHCVQLGLSHEEAAYVLSLPLGTVKTHALRGRAKLKTWLAAWHPADGDEEFP
ncbi:sigma-70 family RNA polymerase sigma factor [Stenotrophomonas sp. 24(2023)]|uniref:RNA polymerase sigma factor n=1 Tax=Stenotrophomonas sp. 24(2023) TaxID=3068324 RepID=UPI0027E03445|nr:sigma-70 family RNA polymerase sigma factor [Stenotrophomonas sp. 24(2023)]WMJ69428.1 sigma-70 family RNA polymerase sigma factor [Stenotrophomonas sp. 24(2023)]